MKLLENNGKNLQKNMKNIYKKLSKYIFIRLKLFKKINIW